MKGWRVNFRGWVFAVYPATRFFRGQQQRVLVFCCNRRWRPPRRRFSVPVGRARRYGY